MTCDVSLSLFVFVSRTLLYKTIRHRALELLCSFVVLVNKWLSVYWSWGGAGLVRARTARGCWAVILMAQAALGRRRSPAQQQDRVQEGVVACYTIRVGLQGRGGG